MSSFYLTSEHKFSQQYLPHDIAQTKTLRERKTIWAKSPGSIHCTWDIDRLVKLTEVPGGTQEPWVFSTQISKGWWKIRRHQVRGQIKQVKLVLYILFPSDTPLLVHVQNMFCILSRPTHTHTHTQRESRV